MSSESIKHKTASALFGTGVRAAAWALSITLTLSPLLAVAPGDLAVVVGVKVGTRPSGRSAVPVDVVVRNTTPHTLTAVYYEITAQYEGDKQRTVRGGEDAALLVGRDLLSSATSPDRAFRPSATKTFSTSVPADQGAPVKVTARVTLVAFDDNTVAGSKDDIESLIQSRKRSLEDISLLVANLHEIAAAQSRSSKAAELVSSLSGRGGRYFTLLGALPDQIKVSGEQIVETYYKVYKQLRDSLVPQCHLKEIK